MEKQKLYNTNQLPLLCKYPVLHKKIEIKSPSPLYNIHYDNFFENITLQYSKMSLNISNE